MNILILSGAQNVKTCSKCKKTKEHSCFYKNKGLKDGLQSQCKECRTEYYLAHTGEISEWGKEYRYKNKEKILSKQRAWREKNLDRLQAYGKEHAEEHRVRSKEWRIKNREKLKDGHHELWIKKTYGMTIDEYNFFLNKQEGKCAICGLVSTKKLVVDHDHITNDVRGLLCHKCNWALGNVNDDIGILEKAINYLRASKQECGNKISVTAGGK